ncbi:18138_t:CDS:2, partial [Gigaspora rosea]
TTILSKKTKVSDTISSSYHAVKIISIEQEIRNNALAQKRTASSIEKKIRTLKREKKSNQRNFDKEEEQDLNKSANTSVPCCCGPTRAQEAIDFFQPFDGFLPPITKAQDGHYINPVYLLQYSYFSTLSYVAKHKCFQHSFNYRKAKKGPEISEPVAKFVVISNSATMKDLDLSLLQQNESYLDEYRECFSNMK